MAMHESMERLYRAAKALHGIDDKPSKLARFLEIDHGKVTNWQRRGLSIDGAIIAKEKIGCNAGWLLFNEGSMKDGYLSEDAKTIIEALPLISEDLRDSWLESAKKALVKLKATANLVA